MRVMGLMGAMLIGLGLWAAPAAAAVSIQVDLSTQTMHVRSGGGEAYDWPVSTARMGYVTPNGHYRVQSLQAMHYSKKYHNSPMPHSIFFRGGYAIHGTYETASLGAAASHGRVRLSRAHSAELFALVKAEGLGHTRVVIEGDDAGTTEAAEPDAGFTRYERARYGQDADDGGGLYADDPAAFGPPKSRRAARIRLPAQPSDDGFYQDDLGAIR